MKHPIFLLCLLAGSFACQPSSTDKPTEVSEEFRFRMDTLFANRLPADGPGGAALVMKDGEIIFSAGYGLADLETKTPITPSTVFNTGSVSKTFVANAILILAEEGKLSLDDPLITYFPNIKSDSIGQQVTLKHMLSHTSGLVDSRGVADSIEHYLTADDRDNWAPILGNDSLYFPVGSQYGYSNPAYNGLALVVEQVSGQPWRQFVQERIFDPAGMEKSTITDVAHPESGVAHGYYRSQDTIPWQESDYGETPTWNAAGNGGIWSTVEELAKYELALQAGTFLPTATTQQARTPWHPSTWTDSLAPKLGYSWFINEHVRFMNRAEVHLKQAVNTVGHTGSQGGFLASYMVVPEHDILFVFLLNGYQAKAYDEFMGYGFQLMEEYNWLNPME